MTTAIAKRNQDQDLNMDLIKTTIAPVGTTNQELALFAEQCKRTGLDPFARQIYLLKQWDSKKKCEVARTQISIDGARVVAERSGQYDGQEGPYWYDGKAWTDVWCHEQPPKAAKVIVFRTGHARGTPAVAHWDEYCPVYKDGSASPMWKKMPALMLAKVAEMLALRKAFPNDLSGLYTQEEMAQADTRSVPQAPPPALRMTGPGGRIDVHEAKPGELPRAVDGYFVGAVERNLNDELVGDGTYKDRNPVGDGTASARKKMSDVERLTDSMAEQANMAIAATRDREPGEDDEPLPMSKEEKAAATQREAELMVREVFGVESPDDLFAEFSGKIKRARSAESLNRIAREIAARKIELGEENVASLRALYNVAIGRVK